MKPMLASEPPISAPPQASWRRAPAHAISRRLPEPTGHRNNYIDDPFLYRVPHGLAGRAAQSGFNGTDPLGGSGRKFARAVLADGLFLDIFRAPLVFQFSHISACRKYWLIAVSSLRSASFSSAMT